MRAIDADALINDVDGDLLDGIAERRAIEKIENAPTLDAVPVVHGLWHDSDFVPGLLSCSICGAQRNPNFKIGGGAWYYCPNCGAKMDGERKEET